MTNLKKSYLVSALAVLALTFCVLMLSQGVMASKNPKHQEVRLDDGVPLPTASDHATVLKAKRPVRADTRVNPVEADETYEGLVRGGRSTSSALSVEQGGEDYSSAVVIAAGSLPVTMTGTTAGFADDYADPCGYDGTSPDVVYSYTPAADEIIGLDLCASEYDTKVWVVNATTLAVEGCNDDGDDCENYQSQLYPIYLTGSQMYYIVIGGYYFPTDSGPYSMDVLSLVEGADCWAPIPIEPSSATIPLTDVFPVDMTQGTCGVPDASGLDAGALYYEFTAVSPGFYTFEWCDDGTIENSYFLGLAGGVACGLGALQFSYTNVAGNECADDGPFTATAVLLPGDSFLMEVFDWCDGMQGTLTVTSEDVPLYNDDCMDAEDLGVGEIYPAIAIHNINATMDGPVANFCDPLGETCADVWYTWEAMYTGHAIFDMCWYAEAGTDSKIQIFRDLGSLEANCADLTRDPDPYGCSDDGCGFFGSGGLVDVTCTAGEIFLIRMAGWMDAAGPCGSMGFTELVIYEDEFGIRPANDDCDDAVPVLLVDGVTSSETGNLWASSWDDCPSQYGVDPGDQQFAWSNFHAFELPACANVQVDYCGTPDQTAGYARSQWTDWGTMMSVAVYTGCWCSGDFVATAPASGNWGNTVECITPVDYSPDAEFNRVWQFTSLIPGTYFFEAGTWTGGMREGDGSYWFIGDDYQINFTSTEIDCAYCEATSNVGFCPPTANASWMCDLSFADLVKDAIDNPVDDPGSTFDPNDCNGYEDHTDMVAHVYRGLTYELYVKARKLTSPYRNLLTPDDSVVAYIDWNQNSGLAANQTELGEKYVIPGEDGGYIYNRRLDITIPLDATLPGEGATLETVMRIRVAQGVNGSAAPCGTMPYGEVEDFVVEVMDLECGDFDLNGLDAGDIGFLRTYYFEGSPMPDYWQRADIDGDDAITIADVVALADALYRAGPLLCM